MRELEKLKEKYSYLLIENELLYDKLLKEVKKEWKKIYRWTATHFASWPANKAPQRQNNLIDSFDEVLTPEEYNKKRLENQIAYAVLDKPLNYCKYFKREQGQLGYYIREDKKYPKQLKGTMMEWDWTLPKDFQEWVKQNWWNDYFDLATNYKVKADELWIPKEYYLT